MNNSSGTTTSSKYGLQVKTLVKLWQTAGLIEHVRPCDGALVFEYERAAAALKLLAEGKAYPDYTTEEQQNEATSKRRVSRGI